MSVAETERAAAAASQWRGLLAELLDRAGIGASGFEVQPIAGGVSSELVRIRLADGRELCAKRALAKLAVADDWRAPVERNHNEVEWLRRAGEIVPGAVPRVLAEDAANHVALMEYLPPARFAVWKEQLLAGEVDAGTAQAAAAAIGRIHAATFGSRESAARFASDAMFDALRLDPYLRTTAARHPDLAPRIGERLAETRETKLALVHGDLSPKNILVARRERRVVLIDAECAWFGDPAFDAAFCLNHLTIKAVHLPAAAPALLAAARTFLATWLAELPAEAREGCAGRAARLIPCLMLARLDGKSPVEYLTPAGRERVRVLATPLVAEPPATVEAILGRVGGAG